MASRELVLACREKVLAAGFVPLSIDVTLVGSRPRLGERLGEMAVAIAALLRLTPDRVSVKASTGNLAGFEGAGRGIGARAVAVLGSAAGFGSAAGLGSAAPGGPTS
jgi:2-C-methyl-D-erythritol 4-phosphate cytidylyltransferase/2-C-methyl-D-erythritol 2,4-cyclodiphosphate synthase